jgi:tyrosinase
MPRSHCQLALAMLLLLLSPPSLFAQPQIEVEVNLTPTEADDYVGWSPVPVQMRLMVHAAGADVTVVVSSSKRQPMLKNGEVVFGAFTPQRPTPQTFQPQDTLTITLPGDGTWKQFWVAGKESSSDGKDVRLIVSQNGTTVKEFPLMVRVRKNAEELTDVEINRFLSALAQLHDLANFGQSSKYTKYVKIHEEAFGAIHQVNPSFPPWHRAMLLSLERELQAIDPRVALPYWKFDEPAPRLFSANFLGTVTGGPLTFDGVIVQFAPSNPINGWAMPSESEIAASTSLNSFPLATESLVRNADGADSTPDTDLDSVMATSDYRLMWSLMEFNYHNSAHVHIGGWAVTGMSPRDPIFFLLHANVDRAWAQWQRTHDRYDASGTILESYAPANAYPGPAVPNRRHHGNYAQDSLWPWNGMGGNQGTADSRDDWPSYAFAMPASAANHGPPSPARLIHFIDYLDVSGVGGMLGCCYDTIRFLP